MRQQLDALHLNDAAPAGEEMQCRQVTIKTAREDGEDHDTQDCNGE